MKKSGKSVEWKFPVELFVLLFLETSIDYYSSSSPSVSMESSSLYSIYFS